MTKWYIYENKTTEAFESITTDLFSDVNLDEHELKVTEKESEEEVITWEKSGSDWIPVTQAMIYDRMNKGELPE